MEKQTFIKNKVEGNYTGYIDHKGEKTYIWDLPEDPAVYEALGSGATETVFQLNTASVTPVVKAVKPTSIINCATITSLVRPGPLDFVDPKTGRNMVEEFIERKFGRSKSDIPVLMSLIPETYGVLVFQEQVSKVARELAGMTVEESENVRIAMGKKKIKLLNSLKPIFISGAMKKVDEVTATKIWDMMATFARYGFNKCLSGDTVLLNEEGNSKQISIAEMFRNHTSYQTSYGQGLSKEDDRLFPNNIVDIRFEGVKDVWEITTESGKTIKATGNHKFPTPNGDVVLDRLKIGDSLFVSYSTEEITSITYYGEEEVYDVEMEHPHHNFVTDSGIVTCNSHAVAYSTISYACIFLKHHYALEWWAAILSTTDTKKINEELYRYVKDMLLPPDINLSEEKILIDYDKGKLRNKLSMITGLGAKVADKIIKARPYVDIEDFISKKVCGPSLTKKLIHVGVLDSLFEKSASLDDKMLTYEIQMLKSAFNKKLIEYDDKITKFKLAMDDKGVSRTSKNKTKFIDKGLKDAEIDSKYEFLTAKADFLLKKSVFPSITLNLKRVLEQDCNLPLIKRGMYNTVINQYGKETDILSGEMLQQIDNTAVSKNVYCCVPAYVVSTETFTFHEGSKKALKLILDSSGYISEKVIWPNFDSGILEYDPELKKGAIAWFFYSKREGKKDNKISQVIIEQKSIL